MRAVLLGKPGSGKGTQARRVAERHAIVAVSSGDLIRAAIADCTDIGKLFDHYAHQGLLVPDDLILAVVEERLAKPDCLAGFLLDGFPRTLVQAQTLEGWLAEQGQPLEAAINIEVPSAALIERAEGRRFCPRDGHSYHLKFAPPERDGICDFCGGGLQQRGDDVAEVVTARVVEYEAKTAPLLDYYRARGLLHNVDGLGALDEVGERIGQALGDPLPPKLP